MDKVVSVKGGLLILRGVHVKDLVARCVVPQSQGTNTVYTEIPPYFTGVDTWIQVSNLRCWECDQFPHSYPKFIPENIEKDKNGNDICRPYGHFCEWNCAVRYIYREYPRDRRPDLLDAVSLFESKFTGVRRLKIMPAPPKTLMKPYCGARGITPQQWRDQLNALNRDYKVLGK